jgi:hypothetical protein
VHFAADEADLPAADDGRDAASVCARVGYVQGGGALGEDPVKGEGVGTRHEGNMDTLRRLRLLGFGGCHRERSIQVY